MITTLGKFEGQPDCTPWMYQDSTDGTWEQDGSVVWRLILSEDADMFPDLREDVGKYVVLEESDQGSVTLHVLDDPPFHPAL